MFHFQLLLFCHFKSFFGKEKKKHFIHLQSFILQQMSHLKLLKVLTALLSVNHALNLAEENIMLNFFSSTSSFYNFFLEPNHIFAILSNKNSWKNHPISCLFRFWMAGNSNNGRSVLCGQNCEDVNFTTRNIIVDEQVSCSPDPTSNSETTIHEFSQILEEKDKQDL